MNEQDAPTWQECLTDHRIRIRKLDHFFMLRSEDVEEYLGFLTKEEKRTIQFGNFCELSNAEFMDVIPDFDSRCLAWLKQKGQQDEIKRLARVEAAKKEFGEILELVKNGEINIPSPHPPNAKPS